MQIIPNRDKNKISQLRECLRGGTRAAHHRVDHHPMMVPLVKQGLSLMHYGMILQFFREFYQAIQPALISALRYHSVGFHYEFADRRQWLTKDLDYLARHYCLPPALKTNWRSLPAISDAPSLAGALYVIEGSALGGRVIARYLQDSLGLDARRGAGFFNAKGSDIGQYWRRYWQFADHLVGSSQDYRAALETAESLFTAIALGLDETWAQWRSLGDEGFGDSTQGDDRSLWTLK